MTAFKTIATLILVSIIGLALLVGPLPGDTANKRTPGQQSPAEPGIPVDGPSAFMVFLALVVMPLVGIGKRVVRGG